MNKIKFLTKVGDTTLGGDPEVFFMKGGDVFPACGLIGGNKRHPRVVDCGALQEDNVMAELNINPTTKSEEFVSNINRVYEQLVVIAESNNCTIGIHAARDIDEGIIYTYDKAKEFGCEPDFNAYTGKANPTPDAYNTLRTCAGHIHIGYEVEGGHTFESSSLLTKYLDAYVGTYCVITDEDTKRMSRYGKAGAFRPKSYGTEYRVPSNFWLKSDELKHEIFNRIRTGYKALYDGVKLPSIIKTIHAINTQDRAMCKEVLSCLS